MFEISNLPANGGLNFDSIDVRPGLTFDESSNTLIGADEKVWPLLYIFV